MVDENNAVVDTEVLDQYSKLVRNIEVMITIHKSPNSYTPIYSVSISGISRTTEVILEEIRDQLIHKMDLGSFSVDESTGVVDAAFDAAISEQLKLFFPYSSEDTHKVLRSYLLSRVLGMGYVDFLLNDSNLEEIAIDSSREPVWVYHRSQGWCKTNIYMSTEEQIKQSASRIARNVGRQINTLNPLLDAYLVSGERVNATISPITPRGNTITVRKFSEDPWTIIKFIENGTLSSETASFIWQIIHYELSVLVVGGTASGKTSMLNALANFIPPNQRILSIEDTRELRLASFLYWIPMLTRLPNAESKGGVTMEDLLVNSLRMRPDRIIVGEVRRKREAETMFEAIHTGHSCYGTFHANNAKEAVARLTNDPVSVPKALLPAIDLLLVQFRNRRTGQRRTLELAEITDDCVHKTLFSYDVKVDSLKKSSDSTRIDGQLSLFTGLSKEELKNDRKERELILDYMLKNKILSVEEVGKVMADYYADKASVVKKVRNGKKLI